jgi:tetratricopeptide (TPR) repeat protein
MVTTMIFGALPAHADQSALTFQAVDAERSGDYDKALQLWRHGARTKPSALASAGEAKILWMLNRREEAKTALTAGLKLEPRNSPALSLLAKIQLSEGKSDEAKRNLELAVESDPRNAEAQRLLADLLGHAGLLDEAHTHFAKLLELQPSNVHARQNVVAYLASSGQVDEAIKVCREGLPNGYAPKKLRLELGHLYLQVGKLAEAGEAFKAARETDSRDTEPYQMLAITCGARGDWVSATAYGQSFGDIDLGSANAAILAAWSAYGSFDLLEAKLRLEKAVQECPNNADLRNLYAIVLIDLRRWPEAAEQLMDAAKIDPENLCVKMNTAMMQLLSGKTADGLDSASKLAHEYPQLPKVKSLYAYANFINGKPAEAAKLAEQTLQKDPADVLAHVVCARVLRGDNLFDEALAHLNDAESTAGGASSFIECEKAETLLDKGNAAQAATAAQHALQLSASNLDAKRALARALGKQGNWDGAVLYLREISARKAKDLPAKLELADALLQQGDFVAAQLVYESAQKIAPNSFDILSGLSKIANRQGNKRLSKKLEREAAAIRAQR